MKKKFVKNAIILVICSVFIKILALANRIILTRLLGFKGISLYTLILPSIMLFLAIGGFSLNTSVAKIVSTTKDGSIIKKALRIAIISSFLTVFIVILIIKPLANDWLKQKNAYTPIMLSIPLIFLSSINNVFRGYYNGLKKVEITSFAVLIEQITRILFTYLLIKSLTKMQINTAVNIAIIAMSIGEIFSIIFITFLLKKHQLQNLNLISNKDILNISFPNTASKLVGNITFFLEPIIFTLAYNILNYQSDNIIYLYSEANSYVLPLIMMFYFISHAIAAALLPYVCEADLEKVKKYTKTMIWACLIMALPIAIIFKNYAYEYMYLIYRTDIGAESVKKYMLLFILVYITPPLEIILQGIDKSKELFIVATITNILELILIFILPFVTNDSFIKAILITYLSYAILLYFRLKKHLHFKLGKGEIVNYFILFFITYCFGYILKVGNFNYLLSSFLILIVFILSLFILNIFRFHNK